MAETVDFRILGPLVVEVDSRVLPLPAGKQRVVLASLLLNANQVVPVGELVNRLWDDRLPKCPRAALHTCVTRLRRSLDRTRKGPAGCVRSTAAGYSIESDADRLDLIRFREWIGSARTAAACGDFVAESAALSTALALWRGPILADVPSASLHRDLVPKLVEERLRAELRRCEVLIGLGRHDESVGELRSLIHRHPFDERSVRLLMLALYRCGRRAEALAVFSELSGLLRDEVGMDPGQELGRLQLAILRDEPVADVVRLSPTGEIGDSPQQR